MTASDWATIIYSYFFVIAGIGSVLWFVAKKAIHHVIQESQADIKTIKNERQDVAMAENTRLTLETVKSLSKLEGRFNNHIEEAKD